MGSIPGLTLWVEDLVLLSAVVLSHRLGSDTALLWLWCRPAAVALIRPQVWESPYAVGVVLKSKKKKKRNKEEMES